MRKPTEHEREFLDEWLGILQEQLFRFKNKKLDLETMKEILSFARVSLIELAHRRDRLEFVEWHLDTLKGINSITITMTDTEGEEIQYDGEVF